MRYYTDEDVKTVIKQRKKANIGLSIIIASFVILSIGFFIWFRTLPYKSPTIGTLKALHYSLTGLYIVVLFIYCGLYLKRINRRYIYQKNMLKGIKETSIGTFLEYSEEIQDKDGVDFKALIFIEWNKYKRDFFERKVLVFADRPFPEITLDAKLQYTTQSNVLLEYEYLGDELDKTQAPKNIVNTTKREKEEYFD